MATFEIEANGETYEVDAPDEATALAAFSKMKRQPSSQDAYAAALENVRQKQYPGMSPEDFQRMASQMPRYQPANLGDLGKNAMTFSLGDEIDSTMSALGSQFQNWMGQGTPGFGEAFANEQALQDARMRLGREQQGIAGAATEIGGSMLTLGPARAGVEAIVQGAPRVAAALPSLLRTGVTGLGAGAIGGAIGGFNNSYGGVEERGQGALQGGMFGAALGAAAPVVSRGIGAAWDNVAGRFAGNQAAEAMGISPDAARFLQTRLAADDAASPQGVARILAGGNEGMLVDAGNSARNTLDYAIQSSGNAGRVAREAIDARVTRDSGAIASALDNALGNPQGIQGMRTAVREGTAADRSAAYRAAYGQPIDYSSNSGRELEELLTRVDPAVIRRANALMRTKGERSAQIIADIGDDGEIVFRTAPDVRQIDYITRALNEEAEAGIGAGAMGGQTTLGAALQDLSRDIRGTLRGHIPEYDVALNTGREAIQTSQALQNGYEALSTGTTREQVADAVRGLSDADRAAYAGGIRSRLDDALANVTRTVMDGDVTAREALKTLRDLSTRASREKVALVIGDDAAEELFGELDRAARSFELRAGVADNSKTFQRQEMGRQVDAVTNPDGVIGALGRGEPVNAGRRLVQAITGFTPERALASKDAMMTEVARALLSQGPEAVRSAQALSQLGMARAGSSEVARALANVGVLGAPAAYQYGRQAGANR